MLNKWNKFKSYLTNSLGEVGGGVPGTFGGGGNPYLRVFLAIGKQIFKFLNKPSVQLSLFVAQGVMAHRAAMKAKRTGADILLQKYGTGAGMPVIYGTRRVGSTVVYMNTINNKELFVVYAIAGHEIDSFDLESIHLDGRTIKDLKIYRQGYDISDGSTRINFRPSGETRASGTFWGNTSTERANITGGANTGDNARMTFNCHVGTDSQAADPMLEGIISEWTSNHKLSGIAYIAANYEYDIQGMFTGIPNLTVVVNGKKVFDPRDTGQTFGTESTYTHSSNAALCLLDYITNDEYGKGLGSADLESDFASWKTAANDCDTSADTITHSSVVVERASTTTDRITIANANEDDYNNFKVGNKFTISDGVTTYVSSKKLIDKDSSLIDIDGTNPVATLQLTFESGAVDTAITSNTTCTFTETQIRFDCNGVLDTDETVLENTKLLIANMRGIFTYSNGEYQIKVEGTESSVVSLDEDDILDSGITLSLENKEAKYNKVESEFYNAQKRYESDTTYYTGETSDSFLSDDGNEVLETRIQLPFCTNQRIAYNHAKAMLKRSRSQKSIAFVATPKVLKAKVGEVISITSSNLNLSSEQYRITNMVINPDLNISVNAVEYQTAVYGYVTPPDEEIGIIQDPVDGYRVEAPTGLTFTNKNSTTGEAAKLTWTDSSKYPSYEFRVQIIDGVKTRYDRRVKDTTFYLDGISVANGYTAKVSAINALGVESDTTDITVNVTTAPVTTPDIEQGSIGGFNFTATKMYYGTAGNFNNTDTAVYFDNAGQFSLKDKLSWNGTTLNISGNLTVENTISADKITLDGQDLSTLIGYGTSGGLSNQFKISNDATFENQFSVVQSTTNPASGGVRLIVGGVADSDGNNFKLEAPSEALDMGLQSSSGVEINVGATDTDGSGNLSLAKFNFAWSDTATQLTLTGKTRHDANVSVNRTAYNLYVDGDDTGYIQHNFNDYLAVKGASGSSVGLLQLYEASNNGTSYVALRSPASLSANTTFVLPSADGTANQVLKTDGSGNLSFSSVSGLSAIASATNMADNRVLTASGSDSVNGEANLTFDGSTLAVTGSLEISADLTVNGTTTTLNTATLDVEDKNITLNYSTGDSSASANGAGITIQDAVNATTDATILWDATNDEFDFSHKIQTPSITTPNITVNETTASSYGFIEMSGTSGAYLDLKSPSSDDYDIRIITTGTGGIITSGSGEVSIQRQGSTKLATTSTGIDVTGTAVVDGLTNSGTTLFNDDVTFIGAGSDMTWDNSADKLNFDDNTKATFGNSDDLQIYHDGNDSYVDDAGTGILFLRGNGAVKIQKYTGEAMIDANADGSVYLYNDNAPKLQTTSSGIDVTGRATTDGLTTSASLISTSNSNSLGGTTFTSAVSGTSLSLSASITASGNSNSFGNMTAGTISSGAITSTGSSTFNTITGTSVNNRLHAVSIGDDADIYLYESATNALSIRTGASGAYKYFTFAANGNFSILNGNLKMGSTAVIDSSRNLTNIGTISSGAITTTTNASGYALIIEENSGGEQYQIGTDVYGGLVFYNSGTKVAEFADANNFQLYHSGAVKINLNQNDNSYINSGFNFGIGTTSPSGKLHVYDSGTDTYGTQPIAIFDYYDTDDAALRYSARIGDGSTTFKTFVTSSLTDFLIVDQDNTAGRLAFQVQGNAGNIEGLAVDSTGLVGIGTTSPLMKLHVNTSGTSGLTGVANRGMIITDSVGARLVLEDTGATSNRKNFMLRSESDAFTISGLNDTGSAFTTENMLVITGSSGDVGIGKVNPAQKLDVQGNIGVGGTEVITSSRNLVNIGTISSGAITSSSTATASGGFITTSDLALRDYTTDARIHLGNLSGGASGVFAGRRLTDSGGLLYGTYWAYDAYWDDTNQNWTANRTTLGRKWKTEMGYHIDAFQVSRFDGTVSSSWSEADWVDLFKVQSATSTFATDLALTSGHAFKIGGTTVIDSSRNLTNIGTISSGAISVTTTGTASGTRTPFYALHSGQNTIQITQFGQSHATAPAVNQIGVSNAEQHLHLVTDTSANVAAGGSTKGIFLRSGGSVGIGTQSPSEKLDVVGGGLGVGNGTIKTVISYNTRGVFGTTSNHDLEIRTNNTERMRIDSSGRVGIGTSSPSAKLHVDGDGSWIRHTGYSQILDMGNWTDGLVRIESTGAPMYIKAAGSNYMAFDTNSTERLRIDSSGNTIFKPSGSETGRFSTSGLSVQGNAAISGNFNTSLGGYQINGTTVIDGSKNFTGVTYGISGTTVIDSSRNLTNIASVATTGNITVDYTGNSTNDAGIAVFNDANDWGIKIDKDGTATYGLLISADGAYPFQITNSSGTEKFRVDAAGDIETVRNINASGTITAGGVVTATSGSGHRFGRLTLRDDSIEEHATDTDGAGVAVNYYGYNGGTTRFRNLNIYDGKQQLVGTFAGSDKTLNVVSGYKLNGTTVINSSRRAFFDRLTIDGSPSENMDFASSTLTIGSVQDDDFYTKIKGFGGNSSMTFDDGNIDAVGDFDVSGSLTKGSGSFKIDHPLKPDTHHLVHSFVEGPQADNLYRGVIDLHNGRATIDLDEWFGMTAGTFLALNRDIQAFVNNADTWDNVRAKVMGSQLVIECQNPESNAKVSWLVIGERQDKEIHESSLTDDHGKVIVEPLKVG